MAEWQNWRKAVKDGMAAGAIWQGTAPGAHLQNEIQRIDNNKVAVAAGNQYGSVWVKAFPDKVVVTYYDAQGKETPLGEFATGNEVSTKA